MKTFIDQMHRKIEISEMPLRVVSLVPSQTELLFDLGLDDRLVGITKFCIYPETWFQSKTRVGGTKKVDLERVKTLNPDLIIGNKEENTPEDIAALEAIAPVWMSDIYTLEDALDMIEDLGEVLQAQEKAFALSTKIRLNFQKLGAGLNPNQKFSVVYLIWKNPYFAVGNNTFIHDMLMRCGFQNHLQNASRYPEWKLEIKNQPDAIFLSSEPFPFQEKDIAELQILCPNSKIRLVNGEYFSWYGSRLVDAVGYFEELIREFR
ncbi:MAG: helical backbone metal receptor [Crocinitomicaceae bacterium]|nr:helical backbone metal receptor [Crocinitomicaceae bacterium]